MRNLSLSTMIAALLCLPQLSAAQDLLVTPQNQKYLFTAGTDETQAFLYNPAYLGLYSRENVLDAYYFYPGTNDLLSPSSSYHDFGAFTQGGKFALAYRNASTAFEDLNQYSVGLGLGDQRLALGVSASLMNITGIGSRWFPAVGIIWRPNGYVSLGAAYHNFSRKPFGRHTIEESSNFGVSVRPLGTAFLTLNADVSSPIHNDGFKVGATVEPIPGLKVYGILDRSGYEEPPRYIGNSFNPPYMWGNSFAVGVSFNFGPHIHVEGASSYQSGGYAATYGRVMFTSQEMPTITHGSEVAEIVIKGNIQDAKERSFLFFREKKTLLSYVEEIKKCGDDPSVTALILKIYPFSTSQSFFSLSGETQELADAVQYVREQGKKVYAYLMDDSGVNELYLASAANRIYMAPVAFISGYGVNLDLLRMKGLFDKLHITWNARTAGRFKSTFHTIYTDSATPEQAQLIKGLTDDIYSQMLKQIEVNRGLTLPDSVKDAVSGIISARDAAADHIIDRVAYYDDFKKAVDEEIFGRSGSLSTTDPASIHYYETEWGKKPEIAVIGVYGDIVTGESSPPSPFSLPFFGSGRTSGSETVAAQLNAASENSDIKAIVLRVNSGGGSALASDQIYNAVKGAAEKKPVIASFGNMAASGGYYVAAGVRRIFAEPATLTGSIGVVIAFPVLTDFLEKDLGNNVEEYKAGRNSDLLSPFHNWNESDLRYVDAFLNETYIDFKEKVAAGRRLSLDRVEELAQGKVYTGTQAKGIDLIDEYGGLDKAIQYASEAAGISGKYQIRMFAVPGYSFGPLFNFTASLLGMMAD